MANLPNSTDQTARAKAVFLGAIELPTAAQRQSYVTDACGSDAGLLAEVRALLDAHERDDSFMARPAVDRPTQADKLDAAEPLGTMIGPYKLLQQIGEGGYGVVYMAEQTAPVRRRVALKIIKPGMDSRQVVARFEAERQALAMMDHPGIARVYDAGATEAGRPYFVMELVKGSPITQYCDANRLPIAQRLELFVQVCHAIQHAHQKGVIHRDIKPSNVLVCLYDGRPVPKVIDFGVAKAIGQPLTDKTMFTHHGHIVGTLQYLSPEQAELSQLDIDTRSDIYALGVLLYELLTGTTPVEAQRLRTAGFAEMLRLIREADPIKPSTRVTQSAQALPTLSATRGVEAKRLTGLIRGDLDWIVMKALEKERQRRYATASEFAADVERHLRDQPVQAGPPAVAYRMRKFVRRYRGPVAAGAAGVALLATGLVVSTILYLRAEDARAVVQQRSAELAHALQQANVERVEKDKALTEKQQALTRSEAMRLAGQSLLVSADDPPLAAALAVEAGRRVADPLTSRAMVAAMLHLPGEHHVLESERPLAPWVRVTSGGRHVAALDSQRHLRLWDADDGSPARALKLFDQPGNTRAIALSPDGDLIATIDGDGRLHIHDARTGQLRSTFGDDGQSYSHVAFSPAGDRLATISHRRDGERNTGIVSVFRLPGLERTDVFTAEERFGPCAFSHDGSKLAVSSIGRRRIRAWDLDTGHMLLDAANEDGQPWPAVLFNPDGTKVLDLGRRGIDVYDLNGVLPLTHHDDERDPTLHNGYMYEVHHDAGLLLTTGIYKGSLHHVINHNSPAMLWDLRTMSVRRVFGSDRRRVSYATLSPEGRYVACVVEGRDIDVYDAVTGELHARIVGRRPDVTAIALGPNAQTLITINGERGEATWWNVRDRGAAPLYPRTVYDLTPLPDDRLALLQDKQGIALLDADTLRTTRLIPIDADWAYTLRSTDRSFLAHCPATKQFAARVSDRLLLLVDETTGDIVRRIERAFNTTGEHHELIRYSSDGSRLLLRHESGEIDLIDTATGESVAALKGTPGGPGWWRRTFAISDNGDRFLIESQHDKSDGQSGKYEWFIHDTRTGGLVSKVDHDGRHAMVAAALSPDGRLLAAAFDEQQRFDGESWTMLILWNIDTGERSAELRGYSAQPWQLAFSPDGRFVATGDNAGQMRVFDLVARAETAAFKAHAGLIVSLAFSPDASLIATTGPDADGGADHVTAIRRLPDGQPLLTLPGRLEHFVGDSTIITRASEGLRAWPANPLDHLVKRGVRPLTDAQREQFDVAQ